MAAELYRSFNAVVKKGLQILPNKQIYSKRIFSLCNATGAGLFVGACRHIHIPSGTPLTGRRLHSSIFKLPWSSLVRSFYHNRANPTLRVRQPSFWTPSLRQNKLGFKAWASLSPPFLLTFPLLPILVHCEGQPTSPPKSSTTKCSCDLRVEAPNCGLNCDRASKEPKLAPTRQQPPVISKPVAVQTENTPEPSACPPSPVISQPSTPTTPPTNQYGMTPIKFCETSELSHTFLMRQACQLTVDSVTRIICETIAAYQDYHEKYRCLLDGLMEALEDSRHSQGVQLDLLDCRIIMMRAEVEDMKCSILELESFMCSVQRLAEATAETSFLGGAEYHSMAMSERLDSVLREMKAIKEESARKERDMIELQSIVIVEAGRGLK